VSARNIGKHINMTHTAVLYHFKSAKALRDAVAVHAVKTRNRTIVPALIVERHPAVAGMDQLERQAYLSGV
jgi:AcrR family transcriptional regulator